MPEEYSTWVRLPTGMAAKLHGPPGTGGAVSAVYWDEVKRGFVQKTDERRQSKAKQRSVKKESV